MEAHPELRESARNLVDYLAIRRFDLRKLQDYVRACAETAAQLHEETEQEQQLVPEAFRDWELANFYTANLRYFWQQTQANQTS